MSDLQKWTIDKPWLEAECGLGEGPFYEKDRRCVRFVDIKKKRVHSVSIDGSLSSLKTIQLDVAPTVTSNIKGIDPSDRILVGLKHGLAILDRETGAYKTISHFAQPQNDRLRSNDGASDPHGRFWIGTMTDFDQGEFRPEGSLYRFDGNSNMEEILTDLTIPNSVGWSPDNSIMYFTHSKSREVFAFDYSVATGTVSNKRVFYQHNGPGEPDGFRVDVEGNIWHAVYGESRVLKIGNDGKLLGQVSLPTKNVTCVQFAGKELIITTAADEDEASDDLSRKYGGAVFRVDVGVSGLDLFEYTMSS